MDNTEEEKRHVKDPEEFCSAQNQQKMTSIDCLGKRGVPKSWMYHRTPSLFGMLLKLLMRWWLQGLANANASAY